MNHIKVYKTDIAKHQTAVSIRQDILNRFEHYKVSLDLDDCDKVLRVESLNGLVDDAAVKNIVAGHGHNIEQLP